MKIKIFESKYADQLQEEVNAFIGCGIEVLNVQHSSSSVVTGNERRQCVVTIHTIVVSYNDVNAETSDPYDDDLIDDLKW